MHLNEAPEHNSRILSTKEQRPHQSTHKNLTASAKIEVLQINLLSPL